MRSTVSPVRPSRAAGRAYGFLGVAGGAGDGPGRPDGRWQNASCRVRGRDPPDLETEGRARPCSSHQVPSKTGSFSLPRSRSRGVGRSGDSAFGEGRNPWPRGRPYCRPGLEVPLSSGRGFGTRPRRPRAWPEGRGCPRTQGFGDVLGHLGESSPKDAPKRLPGRTRGFGIPRAALARPPSGLKGVPKVSELIAGLANISLLRSPRANVS